ncbi:hypothetical protein [Tuwongella immobilis]|uniref:Secreted protein: Uncharacterized protein n=1 Tax=Tuwongella immobilis TaxID=692036 RepID=A0A6C2YU74_9BACT|nr:hypothetical protein [Tuwongella immobilis]VIP04693.1 secreted protein : Uncharacterized protein OS=Planctomyces maris DSM 8797 GN=PM8797T_19430 PE=4 SV=1 [Tuwongella immobilis]VTS06745.1 secreted protein : Uncharacterized protein OS=Planctomyces maris DSM 8797 GN=PM8797T_19430 PE=4 SV=1 [Tuwongella immobilis]
MSSADPAPAEPRPNNEQPAAVVSPSVESTLPPPPDTPIPLPPMPPAPPAEVKPSIIQRWPEFFGIVDALFIASLLITGFLIASFAARNSDYLQHLATGRLIAEGTYSFGQDPFAATERTWVNHSWLIDWLTFQTYQFSEPLVVGIKAFLVMALMAVLLLQRQRGEPIWIWTIALFVGLLAIAPRANLQPVVVSYFLLGVLMTVLLREKSTGPVWRLPAIVAGICAVWANCDSWFILGPIVVALVCLGAFIQNVTDPGSVSDTRKKSLLLAVPVSIAACMLSPFHVQVWQLPPEVFDSTLISELRTDPLYRNLFLTPFDGNPSFITTYAEGNPINAIAYFLLLGVSLVAFAVHYARLRWSGLLVWSALAVLSIVHARAIPFFVIVAAPLTAATIVRISREQIGPMTQERIGTLLGLFGRTVVFLLAFVIPALTWPGLLNSYANSPALARRVDWRLTIEPGAERIAQQIRTWRTSGQLPPEIRGVAATPEVSQTCNWIIPTEPTVFDHRYNVGSEQLEDFMALRNALRKLSRSEVSANVRRELLTAMDRLDADYLIIDRFDVGNAAPWPGILLDNSLKLWFLEGRYAIFGRTDRIATKNPTLAKQLKALEYDPVQVAFDPRFEPVSAPRSIEVGAPYTFWDRFIRSPNLRPRAANEAEALGNMYQIAIRKYEAQVNNSMPARWLLLGPASVPLRYSPLPSREMFALSVLQLRAIRQALSESADDPRMFFTLAESYQNLQVPPEFRDPQYVTALRRALNRIPPPKESTRRQGEIGFLASIELSRMHQGQGRLDLAVEMLRQAENYLRYAPPVDATPEGLSKQLKQLEETQWIDPQTRRPAKPEDIVQKRSDDYINFTERQKLPLIARAQAARQIGLVGEAVKIYRESIAAGQFEAETGAEYPLAAADYIGLLLAVGDVERAIETLNMVMPPDDPTALDKLPPQLRAVFERHQFQANWMVGNYPVAAKLFALMDPDSETVPPIAKQLPPMLLGMTGMAGISQFLGDQQILLFQEQLRFEANRALVRGTIALEEGDNPTALVEFRKALNPRGVRTDLPVAVILEQYIAMLEQAAK